MCVCVRPIRVQSYNHITTHNTGHDTKAETILLPIHNPLSQHILNLTSIILLDTLNTIVIVVYELVA